MTNPTATALTAALKTLEENEGLTLIGDFNELTGLGHQDVGPWGWFTDAEIIEAARVSAEYTGDAGERHCEVGAVLSEGASPTFHVDADTTRLVVGDDEESDSREVIDAIADAIEQELDSRGWTAEVVRDYRTTGTLLSPEKTPSGTQLVWEAVVGPKGVEAIRRELGLPVHAG